MFTLEGKTAFITGGAAGIGLGIAKRYIKAGAKVVIADLADGTAIAENIGAAYLELDVSDEEQVQTSLEKTVQLVGKLDIVVNNAGITGRDNFISIAEGKADHLLEVFKINAFGVFFGLKHAPDLMNDGGSIITTSSLAAVMGVPGNSQYSATKAAINSFCQIAALELGPRKIRVNSVCPGFINTQMGASNLGTYMSSKVTALGRIGEVEELVGVYHFLAADESRYITGQVFNVDGGWTAGVSQHLMEKYVKESGWNDE
jgi:NAD(P)-dependent dehydrogenase (short-subunit alcohol dehydrogenase family)